MNINQLTRLVLMFMLLVLVKIRGWWHQKNDKSGGTLNRYKRNGRQFIEIYWIEFYYKSLFSVHTRFKVRPKLAVRRQRVIHLRLTIFERLLFERPANIMLCPQIIQIEIKKKQFFKQCYWGLEHFDKEKVIKWIISNC